MKIDRLLNNILIKPGLWLSLITTLCVFLIGTGSLNSWDTYNRLQVTHSLWMNVPQVKEEDARTDQLYIVKGKDGNNYATWGIGQSLVMLPADIMSHQLTSKIDKPAALLDKIRAGMVAYLTFVPINVFSIVISFLFLRDLGFNNKRSIVGALTLLFGTSFLAYAQTHQENSLLFAIALSGYVLSLKWVLTGSKLMLLLSALALGFGLLVRVSGIIDIGAVFLFVMLSLYFKAKSENYRWPLLKKRILEYVFISGLVYLFFLGVDRIYHWSRFGTLLGTYSSIWAQQFKATHPDLPPSFPFSTPFEVGFFGALFSPERSMFMFNPLLIITLILSIKYWRKINITIGAFILANTFLSIAYISAYAKWFMWGGASSWGPRYLTTPMQLLSFLSIPLLIQFYPDLVSSLEKIFYKIVCGLSVLIQLSSVTIHYGLEHSQAEYFHKPIFGVVQRFVNLVAILTGNFEKWGLMPYNISAEETHTFLILRFLPWTISGQVPSLVSNGLKIAWLGGSIFLIWLVLIFLKNISAGSYDRYKLD
jgi:hypothetical protein